VPLFGRSRHRLTLDVPQGDAIFNESLVASAERTTPELAAKYRRLSQPWQRLAFQYYATLGECWYPAQFYAKALTKLRIYAARLDENGEVKESGPDTWESQQLDRIQDPGGGRAQLFYNYGRLWFLIGEAYLLGQDDDNGEEKWEFLSSSELRAIPGGRGYVRFEWPGAAPTEITDAGDEDFEPVGEGAVVYRFWNPHPEYSRLADSPVRAVLPLYQQIELLEASFNARLKSRLAAAGILVLSDEITYGSPDGQNDDDPKSDPTSRQLHLAMIRPIQNPASAGAVAPIIIRAPAHMIAENSVYQHIKIHDPNEEIPELKHWETAVQRVALGLDMPPEVLLGMTDANHWTAWQVDDQTWTAHLDPVARALVDNLGSAYLRPLARQEEIAYADEIVVGFDEAEIVNHPDRTQDAKDLHDRLVIGDETLREVTGFDDDDAPTPEEMLRGILLKTRNAAILPEFQQNLPISEQATPPAGEFEGAPPEPTPGQQQQNEQQQRTQMSATGWTITGAALFALDRSRERAGARIVSAARKPGVCPECVERTRGLAGSMIAPTLGGEQIALLGLNANELVAGGADPLRRMLPQWGVASNVADRLAALVETHAARTLYETSATLPDGIVELIERAA
jgi:hypothetical protein